MTEPTNLVYKKADLSAAKSLKDAMEASRAKFLELKVGQNGYTANPIRIAPPHVNMNTWFQAVWVHFNIGPVGRQRTVGCPRKMFNEDCPICEAAFFLKDSGQEEFAKRMYPKQNYLMNVFKLNKEGQQAPYTIADEVVYVLGCGQQLFGQIWDEFDPDQAGNLTVDLTDVEGGYNLLIKSKESDKRFGGKAVAEHKVTKAAASTPFPGDLELLNKLHDLTALTEFLKPDAAMALLEGKSSGGAPQLGDPWADDKTPALPVGDPEFPDEEDTAPTEVADGEFREVETPAEAPSAVDTAAQEIAEAAVQSVKNGNKRRKAAPAEETPPTPAAEEATAGVADLKAFLAARRK